MKYLFETAAIMAVIAFATTAEAAVSASEAAKLKSTLTPLGAEKAGNADGSIPAWTGGMVGPLPGYEKGGRRPDPFAGEKPIYSITAANVAQYGDKLTEGLKEEFKRNPDTFRVDVYKTQRTAAAPQWLYDNTFKNATSGTIIEKNGERYPQNVYGGTPFPIPQDGLEIVWNHIVHWTGIGRTETIGGILMTADGNRVLEYIGDDALAFPYYADPKGDASEFRGDYQYFKLVNSGPPIRAGGAIIVNTNLDRGLNHAWVYVTGQRRVRQLPNACCDTPSPASAGVMSFDEFTTFANSPYKFDWKIVGKKEMIIPYNSNMNLVPDKYETVMSPHHMNPDYMRFELHRVWVVEATLRAGERHVAPHSTYYFDEDTWQAILADRYDANGMLWKMMWSVPVAMPDLPGQIITSCGFYDFASGAWFLSNAVNEGANQFTFSDTYNPADFTSNALAAEGVR